MTSKIACNTKPGRLFTNREMEILLRNYVELLAMLYLMAERNRDHETLRILEAIIG